MTMLAAMVLQVMTVLGIALTWLSLRDDRHAPPTVRSDEANETE